MQGNRRTITSIVLLLWAGLIVACSQQSESADVGAEVADEVETEEAAAEIEAAEEPSTVTPPLPTPPHESNDEACLNCHTDEDILKALATEAEPGEALSSGEG